MKKKIYGNIDNNCIGDGGIGGACIEPQCFKIIEEIHEGFWMYTAPNGFHWTDSTGRNLGRVEYSRLKEDKKLILEEDEIFHH